MMAAELCSNACSRLPLRDLGASRSPWAIVASIVVAGAAATRGTRT